MKGITIKRAIKKRNKGLEPKIKQRTDTKINAKKIKLDNSKLKGAIEKNEKMHSNIIISHFGCTNNNFIECTLCSNSFGIRPLFISMKKV